MTTDKKVTPEKAKPAKGWKVNKDAPENGKGSDKPGLDASTVKSTRKSATKAAPEQAQESVSTPEEGANAIEAATDTRAHAREAHNRIPDETIDLVLAFIADGLSLVKACNMPDMPNRTSFMRRLAADKDLQVRYALAASARAEYLAEEAIEISDDTSQDTVLTENGPRANTEWISRSKLRVETRKWFIAKLDPKKWGDKIDVDHGIQEGNPIMALLASLGGASALPIVATPPDEDD